MLLHTGCTILIDVFVVTRNDLTSHAPKVFNVFHFEDGFLHFFFILLKVSSSGHFATRRSRNVKQFEGSPVPHIETTDFLLCETSWCLNLFDVNFGG